MTHKRLKQFMFVIQKKHLLTAVDLHIPRKRCRLWIPVDLYLDNTLRHVFGTVTALPGNGHPGMVIQDKVQKKLEG